MCSEAGTRAARSNLVDGPGRERFSILQGSAKLSKYIAQPQLMRSWRKAGPIV
jgi:hypothetical protein